MRPRTNLTGRVGLWSGRHPWRAIGIWLAFIVIAVVAGGAVGTNKLHDGDQAVGEAGRAQHTIAGAFEQHADEQVLLHSSKTTVSEDPQYQAAIRDVVARVQGTELALDVRSPLDERYRNQVSADGHSALVTFQVAGTMDDAATTIPPVLQAVQAAAAAHPGYDIAEAGDASIHKALNDTAGKDFENAERLSVPIALFVLLVTFGALVAATLPLGLALTAVIGATGLVALCGMFFTGSKIFVGMGEATVLVVATAVLGSLTVLPALMSLLGHRIERGASRSSAGCATPRARAASGVGCSTAPLPARSSRSWSPRRHCSASRRRRCRCTPLPLVSATFRTPCRCSRPTTAS